MVLVFQAVQYIDSYLKKFHKLWRLLYLTTCHENSNTFFTWSDIICFFKTQFEQDKFVLPVLIIFWDKVQQNRELAKPLPELVITYVVVYEFYRRNRCVTDISD